jgi:hypothetical protein
MKVFPPSPEVEIVIRRSVGVTRSEIKNQVVILEVITHHGNAIRIADVCTKIVEVACL